MPCSQHNKKADCTSCGACKGCPNTSCGLKHGTGRCTRGRSKIPCDKAEIDRVNGAALAEVGGKRTQPCRSAADSLLPGAYLENDVEFLGGNAEDGDSHPSLSTIQWDILDSAAALISVSVPHRLRQRRTKLAEYSHDERSISDAKNFLADIVQSFANLLAADDLVKELLCENLLDSSRKPNKPCISASRIASLILNVKRDDRRRVLRSLLSELPINMANRVL
jgi:hypothetical protein